MLPVASPTKCRKSCGSVPEADTLKKDFHNKKPALAEKSLPGLVCLLCKSFCKALASIAKQQDLHDLVGNATGIMPVLMENQQRMKRRSRATDCSAAICTNVG